MDLVVSDVPGWLLATFAFVFGACWGSFFNVAIYRWPRGLSVVRPPSHCPHCRARIPGFLNVPIVGYLVLRGKTGCCGQPLSARYPVVEALGAVLCLAVVQRFVIAADPGTPLVHAALVALAWYAFAGGLLIATFVDLERMEIPDEVTLPGAALGLATATFRDPPGAESAALGAGAGFLLVQVLFVWTYRTLLGRRGMGEGDATLLLMIGAFVGWQGVAFALFAGSAQGLIVAAIGMITGRKLTPELEGRDEPDGEGRDGDEPGERPPDDEADDYEEDEEPPPRWAGHQKLPFGPFLSLAALEYLFFGDVLVPAWMDFAGGVMQRLL